MTINEMFNMAKGQTLTQDGCEADVDDKRYNIGDISQKTGLQKTANGWVKPRSGAAPGAKTGPGESPKGNGPLSPAKRKAERIAKMQKETGKADPYGRTLKGTPKTPDDNPLTERTQARAESKTAEWKPDESAHLSHKDHVSLAKEVKSNSLPGNDWTAEEIAKEWKLGKGDAEEVKKEFDKIKNRSHASLRSEELAQPAEKTKSKPAKSKSEYKGGSVAPAKALKGARFRWDFDEDGKREGFLLESSDGAQVFVDKDDVEGTYPKYKIKPGSAIHEALGLFNIPFTLNTGSNGGNITSVTDCAPRVLTKDTKIRVRKA